MADKTQKERTSDMLEKGGRGESKHDSDTPLRDLTSSGEGSARGGGSADRDNSTER